MEKSVPVLLYVVGVTGDGIQLHERRVENASCMTKANKEVFCLKEDVHRLSL